jgi:pyroglutamyl-peptidase
MAGDTAGEPPGRIVVTGFGPFPGVPENPSAALLQAMRTTPGLLPPDTEYHLVGVSYAAVPPVLEAVLADPPAALVLTGYSSLAEGLRLEVRAHDYCSPDHQDAFGMQPETTGEVRAHLEQLRADLPALAGRVMQAGIACTLSHDAGAYLCNHIYHQALGRIAAQDADTLAVFVHLPAVAGTPLAEASAGAMPLGAMARGVALIARELAGRD